MSFMKRDIGLEKNILGNKILNILCRFCFLNMVELDCPKLQDYSWKIEREDDRLC